MFKKKEKVKIINTMIPLIGVHVPETQQFIEINAQTTSLDREYVKCSYQEQMLLRFLQQETEATLVTQNRYNTEDKKYPGYYDLRDDGKALIKFINEHKDVIIKYYTTEYEELDL